MAFKCKLAGLRRLPEMRACRDAAPACVRESTLLCPGVPTDHHVGITVGSTTARR